MSSEGVELVSRVALVAVLIVVTAVVRTWTGPNKTRQLYMGLGTLGGMAAGIAAAAVISPWIGTDVSVIVSCFGIVIGWIVAGMFARRIPRETN